MDKRKILLVDDEKSFTTMLKLNLEASGRYEVEVENSAVKALKTAMRFRPELILLDIIMPQKEGPDVAVDLKSVQGLNEIPIVFLTATITKQEAEEEGGRVGGHPFVAKPSSLAELMDSIETYLGPGSMN